MNEIERLASLIVMFTAPMSVVCCILAIIWIIQRKRRF